MVHKADRHAKQQVQRDDAQRAHKRNLEARGHQQALHRKIGDAREQIHQDHLHVGHRAAVSPDLAVHAARDAPSEDARYSQQHLPHDGCRRQVLILAGVDDQHQHVHKQQQRQIAQHQLDLMILTALLRLIILPVHVFPFFPFCLCLGRKPCVIVTGAAPLPAQRLQFSTLYIRCHIFATYLRLFLTNI